MTLALPHDINAVERYLNLVSGIVITGGAFDVDPEFYGEKPSKPLALKPKRTAFEMALLRAAVFRKMPILGICGGEQVLNVVLGENLMQHIPDEVPDALEHLQDYDCYQTSHSIDIEPNTLLHRLVGATTMEVNTSHHQAVKDVQAPVLVSAKAPDGVVEAIELPADEHTFCLGVQWHPEFQSTPHDTKIIAGFVKAARAYHDTKEHHQQHSYRKLRMDI